MCRTKVLSCFFLLSCVSQRSSKSEIQTPSSLSLYFSRECNSSLTSNPLERRYIFYIYGCLPLLCSWTGQTTCSRSVCHIFFLDYTSFFSSSSFFFFVRIGIFRCSIKAKYNMEAEVAFYPMKSTLKSITASALITCGSYIYIYIFIYYIRLCRNVLSFSYKNQCGQRFWIFGYHTYLIPIKKKIL